MRDDLGNRMKEYEKAQVQRFMPLLPICVRLDGKGFSKWTKGLDQPYDVKFRDCMITTMKQLIKESGAIIGYTQSDEISLILFKDNTRSQVYFDGKVQKIVSVLASIATAVFNVNATDAFPDKMYALFDCRAWQVPTLQEAVNMLIWREQDATKNSITSAASTVYSHKQLMNKSGKDKQDMLMEKGINWNDYPWFFKRGVYAKRVVTERLYTFDEWEKIPEKIRNKIPPKTKVKRANIEVLVDFPKLSSISNAVDVIFNDAEILLKSNSTIYKWNDTSAPAMINSSNDSVLFEGKECKKNI
jgi:tRNA(His) guanylyltransferase